MSIYHRMTFNRLFFVKKLHIMVAATFLKSLIKRIKIDFIANIYSITDKQLNFNYSETFILFFISI